MGIPVRGVVRSVFTDSWDYSDARGGASCILSKLGVLVGGYIPTCTRSFIHPLMVKIQTLGLHAGLSASRIVHCRQLACSQIAHVRVMTILVIINAVGDFFIVG